MSYEDFTRRVNEYFLGLNQKLLGDVPPPKGIVQGVVPGYIETGPPTLLNLATGIPGAVSAAKEYVMPGFSSGLQFLQKFKKFKKVTALKKYIPQGISRFGPGAKTVGRVAAVGGGLGAAGYGAQRGLSALFGGEPGMHRRRRSRGITARDMKGCARVQHFMKKFGCTCGARRFPRVRRKSCR